MIKDRDELLRLMDGGAYIGPDGKGGKVLFGCDERHAVDHDLIERLIEEGEILEHPGVTRMKRKTVRCPACEGQGEVTIDCPKCAHKVIGGIDCVLCGMAGIIWQPCERCGGTAQVNDDDLTDQERITLGGEDGTTKI